MKLFIPAVALLGVVLLSSCSSMYRSGQTPDDVYFSPGRTTGDVASNSNRRGGDEYDYVNPDDNYLRQKVQNRSRWSTIDDADYWYSYNRPYSNFSYGYNAFNTPFYGNGLSIGFGNPYGLGGLYGYNNFGGYPFWNTFSYGNYGYPGSYGYSNYGGLYGGHGYYPGSIIVNQPLRSNTGPKPYMGGFTNNSFNNSNNQQRNSSRLGSFMRSALGNGNNTSSRPASTYDNNTSRPVRTFTPSTPSSSPSYSPSSSSRGSSGASSGGSRPSRGGN